MLKKTLALTFFLTIFTIKAHAFNFFPLNPLIQVNAQQVTAQIYNPYYEPIACSGQAFGITARGLTYNSYFNDSFIPAGQTRFAFVRSNIFFDPFINGWGTIWCRFVRFF